MRLPTPVAALMSDVHFASATLSLADSALRSAIKEAARLKIPLIIAGDLNDTKMLIRGDCANAIIAALKYAKELGVAVYILIGNHDLLNEKGEAHSLNFLRPYATIIDTPTQLPLPVSKGEVWAIPYQNDSEKFLTLLARNVPPGSTVIAHQGVRGAYMGEYVVDKTSVDASELEAWTIISGHYHRHQTVGTLTYIGSPYTITFAEAGDGPKGFQILHSDSKLKQVPLNLRRHMIVEASIADVKHPLWAIAHQPGDMVWLKVSGPAVELDQISKKQLGLRLFGHQNYRLERLSIDVEVKLDKIEQMTPEQMLDDLIEQNEPDKIQDGYLRKLWREIMA